MSILIVIICRLKLKQQNRNYFKTRGAYSFNFNSFHFSQTVFPLRQCSNRDDQNHIEIVRFGSSKWGRQNYSTHDSIFYLANFSSAIFVVLLLGGTFAWHHLGICFRFFFNNCFIFLARRTIYYNIYGRTAVVTRFNLKKCATIVCKK